MNAKIFRFFAVLALLLLSSSNTELLFGQGRGSDRREPSREQYGRMQPGREAPRQGMRGDMMPRPGGMPMPPGGMAGGDRNERMLGMLRAMDSNRNGRLEAGEVPAFRREFVNGVVRQMGGNPSGTIDLNALSRQTSGRQNQTAQSGQNRQSQRGTNTQNALNLPLDPLVPYFGEPEVENTPVLAFGQKEPETPPLPTQTMPVPANPQDQILRAARDIMNRYDKTKSGTLDQDKEEWVSSLPFKANAADKNFDGRISMAELIEVLGGQRSVSTGAAAVSTKPSTAYDRLPPGTPDWFFDMDKNEDGQLSLLEYLSNRGQTEDNADEFRYLDKNNDGVATIKEIFLTLKQVDDEKRLKEEQVQREQMRRMGTGATANQAANQKEPQSDEGRQDGEVQQPVQPGTPETSKPMPVPATQPPSAPPSSPPSAAPYASGTDGASNRNSNSRGSGYRGNNNRSERRGRNR